MVFCLCVFTHVIDRELPRHDIVYEVGMYGKVVKYTAADGTERSKWETGESLDAIAYDVPIPGYDTKTTINIRLWRSVPKKKFDLQSFNEGNYQKSVEENMKAENITSVLYPNDNTMAGKELRLKQQVGIDFMVLSEKNSCFNVVLFCFCDFARHHSTF